MINPRSVALQGIGLATLAVATQGFIYTSPEVTPPTEYLIGWGRAHNRPIIPYYDDEMEMKELQQVLRAFLRVVS